MSFSFKWPRFSDQFHADAIQMLNNALNKGTKPPVLAERIEVVELEMGTQPPELEIRDIGDLTMDQFRGIFRLNYAGDAHIVLKTKVQANPLNHKHPDIHIMTGSRGMLAAKQPLVVPMLLRLSHFKLSSYVVLVISKQKGITLVFKTDPLQHVDINSTFDSIAVIQQFIQKEIEGQLRQMFREDLPSIIHRLSQQWVKAKVEAPYLDKRPLLPRRPATATIPSRGTHPSTTHSSDVTQLSRLPLANVRRPSRSSETSLASSSRRTYATAISAPSSRTSRNPSSPSMSLSPDTESFDPTYGLRPEGLPAKSVFRSFSELYCPDRGLADLAEDSHEDNGYDDVDSFDLVDWEEAITDASPPPSVYERELDENVEYEAIPAVGGGTVMRPRVYHSQSQIQPPSGITPRQPNFPLRRSTQLYESSISERAFLPADPSGMPSTYAPLPAYGFRSNILGNWTRDGMSRTMQTRSPTNVTTHHPGTPDSLETQVSESCSSTNFTQSSLQTPPFTDIPAVANETPSKRLLSSPRPSFSTSTINVGSPPSTLGRSPEPDPRIILRPALNNTIHQLSTLSLSNHTLSPYTRPLSHFTVRSFPPRSSVAVTSDRQPPKARRKRIFRLGGVPQLPPQGTQTAETEPIPSSPDASFEFDADELDRYFRSCDSDFTPNSPKIHPTHLRRRHTCNTRD